MLAGVLLGYVAMAASVFGLFAFAWVVMGSEGAFRSGSFAVSGAWVVMSLIVNVVAAVGGGNVARLVSRERTASVVLAAVILTLGLALIIPELGEIGAPDMRAGSVSMLDAISRAHQPAWVMLLTPVLGAIGAYIGGRLPQ